MLVSARRLRCQSASFTHTEEFQKRSEWAAVNISESCVVSPKLVSRVCIKCVKKVLRCDCLFNCKRAVSLHSSLKSSTLIMFVLVSCLSHDWNGRVLCFCDLTWSLHLFLLLIATCFWNVLLPLSLLLRVHNCVSHFSPIKHQISRWWDKKQLSHTSCIRLLKWFPCVYSGWSISMIDKKQQKVVFKEICHHLYTTKCCGRKKKLRHINQPGAVICLLQNPVVLVWPVVEGRGTGERKRRRDWSSTEKRGGES